ncbi:hypothetical protein BKA67DRAFT_499897, partial [Truncatella angustata]
KVRLLPAAIHFLVCSLALWAVVTQVLRYGSESCTIIKEIDSPTTTSQKPSTYKPDVYRPKTLAPGVSSCYCGTTIREAMSLGCIYDSLSVAWLPSYCRDEQLTVEFEHAGPGIDGAWSYFRDRKGLISINKTEMAALAELGGTFWASQDWHIAHCLFYWQKYVRMRDTGAVMEAFFDSLHHAKHCTRLIRNPAPGPFVLIEVDPRLNSS